MKEREKRNEFTLVSLVGCVVAAVNAGGGHWVLVETVGVSLSRS